MRDLTNAREEARDDPSRDALHPLRKATLPLLRGDPLLRQRRPDGVTL